MEKIEKVTLVIGEIFRKGTTDMLGNMYASIEPGVSIAEKYKELLKEVEKKYSDSNTSEVDIVYRYLEGVDGVRDEEGTTLKQDVNEDDFIIYIPEKVEAKDESNSD